MSNASLADLVSDLDAELAADPRGPNVAAMLESYARSGAECWHQYRLFMPDCYARNAVHCGEAFELIVICWQADQMSAIHDHDEQRCWMTVLDGSIRESLFDRTGQGQVLERSTRTLAQGQVAFITDQIALHRISSDGGPAVSLHLYAKPIRSCRTYCPDTGRSDLRRLNYHTVGGEPVGGAT